MNLECKLTSCDLKHKRSLLPQIKSWGLLAKLVSVSGPAGTSAGRAGHPRCCHVHEDGSASSSLKAVCPGHNVRPGCGLSIPDGPSLLICSLRDFQAPHGRAEPGPCPAHLPGFFLPMLCQKWAGHSRGAFSLPTLHQGGSPQVLVCPHTQSPLDARGPGYSPRPPPHLPASPPSPGPELPFTAPHPGFSCPRSPARLKDITASPGVEMLNRSRGNREDVLTHRAWPSQPLPSL